MRWIIFHQGSYSLRILHQLELVKLKDRHIILKIICKLCKNCLLSRKESSKIVSLLTEKVFPSLTMILITLF